MEWWTLNGVAVLHIFLLKLREHWGRTHKKNVTARPQGGLLWNNVFWSWYGHHCPHEFPEVVATYTRSKKQSPSLFHHVQGRAWRGSISHWESIGRQLIRTGERKVFSFVLPLINCLWSNEQLSNHSHTSNHNQTYRVTNVSHGYKYITLCSSRLLQWMLGHLGFE